MERRLRVLSEVCASAMFLNIYIYIYKAKTCVISWLKGVVQKGRKFHFLV